MTPTRRDLLGGAAVLAAAPTASATPVPGIVSPSAAADAYLLQLGAAFEAAWTTENAAYAANIPDADNLSEVTGEIVQRMLGVRASSLPALLVKARAIRWCCCNDPIDEFMFCGNWREELATNQKLILSLVTDLYALTAGEVKS